MRKITISLSAVVLMSAIFTGCSSKKDDSAGPAASTAAVTETAAPISTDPVTLNVLWSGRQDEFNDRVDNDIIHKKLPFVTVQFYSLSTGLDKIIASGVKLDVMNITTKVYYDALRLGLNYDMTDLIKKEKFDLTRFVPEQLEAIKKLSKDGKMNAVPDKANFPYALHGLIYNKDIFDKFSIPYPVDNMTWTQVLELAKRVNRLDNGQKYYGLELPTAQYMYEAAALNYTDASNKVNLSNPLFSKIFDVYQQAHMIAGIEVVGNSDPFKKDKNVAMFAGNVDAFIQDADRSKDQYPNWDIVTFPHFDGLPTTVPPTNGVYLVASTSDHKEQALMLIDALLSKENTQQVVDQYMNPEMLKKNVNAVKAPKQSLYVPGEFDSKANSEFNNRIRDMEKNNVDINTELRTFTDNLTKTIEDNQ